MKKPECFTKLDVLPEEDNQIVVDMRYHDFLNGKCMFCGLRITKKFQDFIFKHNIIDIKKEQLN